MDALLGGRNEGHAKPGDEQQDESRWQEPEDGAGTRMARPGVEVDEVGAGRDKGPGFLGIPGPVVSPGFLGPDGAREHAEDKEGEAEPDGAVDGGQEPAVCAGGAAGRGQLAQGHERADAQDGIGKDVGCHVGNEPSALERRHEGARLHAGPGHEQGEKDGREDVAQRQQPGAAASPGRPYAES